MGLTNEQMKTANAAIAEGMAYALGLWFVPIPVAGSVACNTAEKRMVKKILGCAGHARADEKMERLFWFFRKKYFLVNVVTFLPYVGATVQLLEVYALGQLVLTCCDEELDLQDETALEAAWAAIEPKMWAPQEVIVFYEGATGKAFPENIRGPFIGAVEQIGAAVTGINRIPGMAKAQEVVGETLRQADSYVREAAKSTWKELKKVFR